MAAGLGIAILDPFTARQFLGPGLAVRPFAGQIDYENGVLFPLRQPYSPLAEMPVPVMTESMARLARSYEEEFPGWLAQATFGG